MWPFSGKQKNRQEHPTITALIDDRGLRNLTDNSAVLRFWLPEAGRIALNQTTKNSGKVAAKYLREFFVTHLYGIHELLKMQAMKEGLYYVPPPPQEADNSGHGGNNSIKFSRSPSVECIPGLGKNLYPFKVFLPQRIKDDLQSLADDIGIPLSQFVREILITHFFGQTFWPAKLISWSEEHERIGIEWENGERDSLGIPYRDIRPEEIDGDHVVEMFWW
jgi:predicted DNA-binding protein